MIKMILSLFRKYALKFFKIWPYAQRQKHIYIFCFWKEEINLNIFLECFWNCWIFFKRFRRKPCIFNTRFVFYSVNIQPNIIQNYWKNMQGTHKCFSNTLWKIWFFNIFLIFNIIIKYVRLDLVQSSGLDPVRLSGVD
jgi:hypothetical protein